MKKVLIFTLALLLKTIIVNAQAGWEQQISGTSETLKACQFLSSDVGYAAGGTAVLFTSNGGTNWISKSSGTLTEGVNGLCFVDATTGWLTGSSGIVKTTDGGSTWVLQLDGFWEASNDIFFFNNSTGWAVGLDGALFGTTDGGSNWLPISTGERLEFNAIQFASLSKGWIVGENSTILATTNGGTSWFPQSAGSYNGIFYDISMISETTGYITGTGGAVFMTTDGGNTWIQQDTKTLDDFYFVNFIDENYGWAGGHFGTIVGTRDGGTTWKSQASTVASPLYDICFITNRVGWTCGTQGKIIHSITGGEDIKANFVADTTIGIQPFTITFTNLSTGYPSSYQWTFGDGETSTAENPVHVYTSSGDFTVTLSITSGTYTGSRIRNDYIIVDDVLTSNFTATPTAGSSTLTVNFQDASLSTPDTWDWDFGDGTSSTFQNPSHSYVSPGIYTVSLTVTNYQGSSTETKEDFITVYDVIRAAFQGAPLTGPAPLTVYFVDYSPGHPNSWNWSFGDGQGSTEQSPNHTYESSGTYTVTLTVSDGIHEDTKAFQSYIRVTDALNPFFSASPRTGNLPLKVYFTDESYGGPNRWTWNFGDEQYSNEQNPEHTYLLPGTYDVELTISDGTFQASELKQDYIEVTGTPVLTADFSAAPLSGLEPLTVQFTDKTQGGVLSYLWDFGDGQTSVEKSPRHVYQNDGAFSVKLIVTNGLNYDTLFKEDFITVFPRQEYELIADFEAEVTEGDKPLLIQFYDRSQGVPNSYNWSFGDGKTSTSKEPSNYYSISGTFTVSLSITDSLGNSDIEEKFNYIVINEPIGVEEQRNDNLLFVKSYPNPFRDFTSIQYNLISDAFVTVKIFDIFGTLVTTLLQTSQEAGNYNLIWNPFVADSKVKTNGIYFYSVTSSSSSGTKTLTGKLILIE
ncbi:MAG: PKD domain-containing protein [bacterium]